jgi:GntR family transcriptional regulator
LPGHRAQRSISVCRSALGCRDLARPQSSPALLSHRISFTSTDIPVIDDHALLPTDSVIITANRSPDHLEVHCIIAG